MPLLDELRLAALLRVPVERFTAPVDVLRAVLLPAGDFFVAEPADLRAVLLVADDFAADDFDAVDLVPVDFFAADVVDDLRVPDRPPVDDLVVAVLFVVPDPRDPAVFLAVRDEAAAVVWSSTVAPEALLRRASIARVAPAFVPCSSLVTTGLPLDATSLNWNFPDRSFVSTNFAGTCPPCRGIARPVRSELQIQMTISPQRAVTKH